MCLACSLGRSKGGVLVIADFDAAKHGFVGTYGLMAEIRYWKRNAKKLDAENESLRHQIALLQEQIELMKEGRIDVSRAD